MVSRHRSSLVRSVKVLVAAVAATWPGPLSTGPAMAAQGEGDAKVALPCQFVSSSYFDVLGIAVLQGRGFLPEERSSTHAVAVLSESAARRLWPSGGAVGQLLRLDPGTDPPPERPPLARSLVMIAIGLLAAGWGLASLLS